MVISDAEYTFDMPMYPVTLTGVCQEKDIYTYYKKTLTNGQKINGVTYNKFTSYTGNPGTESSDVENTNTNSDYIQTRRKQGQALNQLPTVKKEGYQFLGWYTAASGGSKIEKTTKLPNKAITYYAQWSPNKYTIIFADGSGVGTTYGTYPSNISNVPFDCTTDTAIAGCTAKKYLGKVCFELNDVSASVNPVRNSSDTGYSYLPGARNDSSPTPGEYKTYTTTLTWTTGKNGSGWKDKSQANNTLKSDYYRGGMAFGGNSNGSSTIPKFSGGTIKGTITNLIQGCELSNSKTGTIYLYSQFSGCSTVTVPSAPSMSYYNFLGWYTEKSEGSKVNVGSTLTNKTGNNAYYAHWDPYDFTINFYPNKPSNATSDVAGEVKSQTVTYDTIQTLNANQYSLVGWDFVCWNTKADGTGVNFSNYESGKLANEITDKNICRTDGGTVNLYAIWKPHTYTVCFVPNPPVNQESTLTPKSLRTVKRGTTIINPGLTSTFTTQGFTYDVGNSLTSNPYKIICYGTDGTCYNFNGWNTKADGTGTWFSNEGTAKNLTSTDGGIVYLYAQWKPYTFTIVFEKNKPSIASHEVSGTMSNQTVTYDEVETLRSRGYSLTGWHWLSTKCWKESTTGCYFADGESGLIANKIVNNNICRIDGSAISFYAQWIQNTFTIYYNPNGGSVSPTVKTVHYDDEVTNPIPSRAGCIFTGWSPNPTGTSCSTDGGRVDTTASWYIVPTPVPSACAWRIHWYLVNSDGSKGEERKQYYSGEATTKDVTKSKYGHVTWIWDGPVWENDHYRLSCFCYNDNSKNFCGGRRYFDFSVDINGWRYSESKIIEAHNGAWISYYWSS